MTFTVTFDKFNTWEEVLDYVGKGEESVFYKAPLDAHAVEVRCELRANGKVRVFPPAYMDCDPFTADVGHLDRFLKPGR